MKDNRRKFADELFSFYRKRGWYGGCLYTLETNNIITIFPSYFNGLHNQKTNKIFPFWRRNDKQYEEYFLEMSKEIINKYKIKKEQINFYH